MNQIHKNVTFTERKMKLANFEETILLSFLKLEIYEIIINLSRGIGGI